MASFSFAQIGIKTFGIIRLSFPLKKLKKYPKAVVVVFCDPLKAVKTAFEVSGIHNELKVNPRFSFRFPCDTEENHIQEKVSVYYIGHKKSIEDLFQTEDVTTNQMLKQIEYERTLPFYKFMDYESYVSDKYDLSHEGHYFSDRELIPENDFTFVDGGGYIGDTFLIMANDHPKHLKKVYAFEPDPKNLAAYKDVVKKTDGNIEVEFIQKGLWSCDTTLRFSANADSGKLCEDGEIKVDVTSIDETVKDVVGDLYIKLDVEGAEAEAIKGAVNTIHKYKPYLQVCLYHKMADIYEIPKLIKDIEPSYRLYLREGAHPEVLAVPQKAIK